MQSVLTICLSPAFQEIILFDEFRENEVNRSSNDLLLASGKGLNVTRVLSNLGRASVNIAQLGGCRVAEFLGLCEKEGLSIKHIPVEAGIRTCITIINKSKCTSTELVEEAHPVCKEDSEKVFSLFKSELPKHKAVIISGTKAKGFSDDLYPRMVEKSIEAGKLVILDIKGDDLKSCLVYSPTFIKPNLSEFVQTFMQGKMIFENDDSEFLKEPVMEIAERIFKKYGTRTIITRGKYDTWGFDGKASFVVQNNTKDLHTINTIGCGDTFTAAFAHSILNEWDIRSAVSFGMECAIKKAMNINQGI